MNKLNYSLTLLISLLSVSCAYNKWIYEKFSFFLDMDKEGYISITSDITFSLDYVSEKNHIKQDWTYLLMDVDLEFFDYKNAFSILERFDVLHLESEQSFTFNATEMKIEENTPVMAIVLDHDLFGDVLDKLLEMRNEYEIEINNTGAVMGLFRKEKILKGIMLIDKRASSKNISSDEVIEIKTNLFDNIELDW